MRHWYCDMWSLNLSNSDLISASAFLVSVCSFGLSVATFWRQYIAEQPNAWLELTAWHDDGCASFNICVQNLSKVTWSLRRARVKLKKYPVSETQDVFIVESRVDDEVSIMKDFESSNVTLILPGNTSKIPIIVRKGKLSDASTFQLWISLISHTPKPRMREMKLKGGISRHQLKLRL